jgi:secretion/DNA translocation related TadE-like protein
MAETDETETEHVETEEAAGRAENGSGTVLMVVVMTLAGFLIMATLWLASALVARQRAASIADLAALAAAGGPAGPQACQRARRVADLNAGRLIGCRLLDDGSVVVEVEVEPARGTARAGRAAG